MSKAFIAGMAVLALGYLSTTHAIERTLVPGKGDRVMYQLSSKELKKVRTEVRAVLEEMGSRIKVGNIAGVYYATLDMGDMFPGTFGEASYIYITDRNGKVASMSAEPREVQKMRAMKVLQAKLDHMSDP